MVIFHIKTFDVVYIMIYFVYFCKHFLYVKFNKLRLDKLYKNNNDPIKIFSNIARYGLITYFTAVSGT